MTEALLVRWIKQPGDPITIGEAVAEIETDKASADLEAPADGVLGRHRFEAGAVVPVGVALAVVLEGGEAEADDLGAPVGGEETTAAEPAGETSSPVPVDQPRHRLSPRQRAEAMAAEALAAATSVPKDAPTPVPSIPGQRERYRALIAENVAESWRTIPHFAVTRDVSADAIVGIRAARKASGRHIPTVTDLLIRALATALAANGGDPPSVGLAVATPAGVVVVAVDSPLGLSLEDLATVRAAAVDKAKAGQLSREELSRRPTCTLSNLGAYGIDSFTGIIAVGQESLLTVGRIARRVVAVEERVSLRWSIMATLNADHRVIDGADAAMMLARFADALEDGTVLDPEPAE
ncbi:MAG: 2-oxo acid dehydrogenase subunit E2 [Chloroflexi bacterium]|nr:2-oxo acid dehydrogenase subunit E2 [Chloroflexota bacterium]